MPWNHHETTAMAMHHLYRISPAMIWHRQTTPTKRIARESMGFLQALLGVLVLVHLLGISAARAQSSPPMDLTVALPGPGTLAYLPVELIPRIGADKAEGFHLTLRHFGGGPLALKDMLGGNSDFAALGFTALAQTKDIQGKAYSVASIVQVPAYTLMVSQRLKGRVKTVRDLRGRTVGTHSGSKQGQSTGQHIAEFLLSRAGLRHQDVNFINTGQSYENYAAALQSESADALICSEPAATRLEKSHLAFRIADLHDPSASRQHLGSLFLYTQLATRSELIRREPEKSKRMVAALARTLKWIQSHRAEEIVARLGIANPADQTTLVAILTKHKAMFSPDGGFSQEQLQGSINLLDSLNGTLPAPDVMPLIDAQWVGLKP